MTLVHLAASIFGAGYEIPTRPYGLEDQYASTNTNPAFHLSNILSSSKFVKYILVGQVRFERTSSRV